MDQTAIFRRHTSIPNQFSQIRAIIIIIASACAVLLTQACHGKSLVLVRWLGGIGRVVETVGVVVVVFVGAVEPESGEDGETDAEEGEGDDAGGGARAGAIGRAGAAGEVTSATVGGGDGGGGAVGGLVLLELVRMWKRIITWLCPYCASHWSCRNCHCCQICQHRMIQRSQMSPRNQTMRNLRTKNLHHGLLLHSNLHLLFAYLDSSRVLHLIYH